MNDQDRPVPYSQYTGATWEKSYKAYKNNNRQSELVAKTIINKYGSLITSSLILEVGSGYGSGAQHILEEIRGRNIGLGDGQFLVSDITADTITSLKKVFQSDPRVRVVSEALDWTNEVTRKLVVHKYGKPDFVLSLYNLFLMSGASDLGRQEALEARARKIEIQKSALRDMIDLANKAVILVQPTHGPHVYKLQEEVLALSGNSLNIPIMNKPELEKIAVDQGVQFECCPIGPEEGNFFTATEADMKTASLFLLGEPATSARYRVWIQKLNKHGLWDGFLFRIPLHDAVYLFKKA